MDNQTTPIELHDQLARDYQALAEMWHELKDDVASEEWLIVENEVLIQLEKSLE